MNEDRKERLKQLQEQQKQKLFEARINDEKQRILREIPCFDQHYQFADKEEIIKLKTFLKNLPALTSTYIDFSQLIQYEVKSFDDIDTHFHVWICFLCGSLELFELYPYGDIQDFINDFENWECICSYFILVFENFKDFIFIDDGKKIIQSQNIKIRKI